MPLEEMLDTIKKKHFMSKRSSKVILNSSSVGPLLKQMGEVGKRLSEIGATEGAAGNISICVRDTLEVREYFPQMQMIDLPVPAPDLVGATILATGSGRRLRELLRRRQPIWPPLLSRRRVATGRMFTSADCPFKRVTSEFNSHLAVHHDQMRSRRIKSTRFSMRSRIHLTYLSHIPKYQDEQFSQYPSLALAAGNDPEFPEGIGVLPFLLPGFHATDDRDHALPARASDGDLVTAWSDGAGG